jgi:hypothetical protein
MGEEMQTNNQFNNEINNEILFRNNYVRSKEMAKEIYRYYFFKRKPLVICYIFLSISLSANIAFAVTGKVYNTPVIILVLLFFAFQIVSYCRYVNSTIKRDNEVHGKEIEVETIVTESFIQNTASTGAVNKVQYDKIKYAVQTKNYILLHSRANLIYIFKNSSFEVGTKDQFILFLRVKGIKVKG